MEHYQSLTLLGVMIFQMGLAGCTTTELAPADRTKVTEAVMEVPVIPNEAPAVHEPQPPEMSGEVQERAVKPIAPALVKPGTAVLGTLSSFTSAYPGEFAFRTQKGYYLTAINGGGRTGDPTVITSATSAGPWEKFKLGIASPPSPYDKLIQTDQGASPDPCMHEELPPTGMGIALLHRILLEKFLLDLVANLHRGQVVRNNS